MPGRPADPPSVATPPPAAAALLDAMFYGLHAGVILLDVEGRIQLLNPRAAELLGRAEEEMTGADSHDLLHREADGSTPDRAGCPLLEALATGEPTRAQETWFECGDGTLLQIAWLMAPYEVDGERSGAVVTFFDLGGQGLGSRQQAHMAALERLADRLAMVAEITALLTSTLDVREALRRLVRLVVPRLADWAVVDLLDGDELVRDAVVHYENGIHTNRRELTGPMPPPDPESGLPLQRVLRGGPALIVSPETYRAGWPSEIGAVQREMFRVTGIHSGIMAALRGQRGVHGALTLGRRDQEKPFDADDLALVDDIARRAGLAVDNARLYDRQRRVSETMQRHLLTPLPRVEGVELAARYLPAPLGSQVGGDWYDAFVLPDHSTMLVIGDVIGHDLQAAAGMSQLRNMLRAFVWDRREPPSLVINRLDSAFPHISDASMATLVLGRLEGAKEGRLRQLHWTNAGHPPPLLIGAGGHVSLLEAGLGALLGTETAAERSDAAVPLPPGSTLVFYTDGLIETPRRSLGGGLESLCAQAGELAALPLGELCDELLARVRPAESEDDVALLAVRIP